MLLISANDLCDFFCFGLNLKLLIDIQQTIWWFFVFLCDLFCCVFHSTLIYLHMNQLRILHLVLSFCLFLSLFVFEQNSKFILFMIVWMSLPTGNSFPTPHPRAIRYLLIVADDFEHDFDRKSKPKSKPKPESKRHRIQDEFDIVWGFAIEFKEFEAEFKQQQQQQPNEMKSKSNRLRFEFRLQKPKSKRNENEKEMKHDLSDYFVFCLFCFAFYFCSLLLHFIARDLCYLCGILDMSLSRFCFPFCLKFNFLCVCVCFGTWEWKWVVWECWGRVWRWIIHATTAGKRR